ncbi:MAG: extracellular solute-binding protein [bacterium]
MKHAMRLLGLAVLLTLAALPGWTRESSKTELHFWYSIPTPYSEVMDRLLQKCAEESTRSFTVQAKNFSSNAELLKALLEDNNTPDIAIVDTRWLDELIKSDRIIPAEDVILKLGEFALLSYKTDNYKPQLNMNTREDKLWALPAYALNYGLIWNKDLFAKAKIAKPPANWNDFLKYAKKLTKIQADQWGFYFPLDPPTLGILFQIALWQSGSSLYDFEKNAFTFNNEIALKAIQRWSDLIHKNKIAPSSEPCDMKNVAMFLGTSEDLLRYEEEGLKLDVVPIPTKQSAASYLKSWSFVIFKKPDARLFETAQFAAWISELPQITEWVSSTKFIAVNKRMMGKPEYFPVRQAHPGLNNLIKSLDNSKITPYLKGYEEVLEIIGKNLSEALRCNGDLKAALEKSEAEANSLLK